MMPAAVLSLLVKAEGAAAASAQLAKVDAAARKASSGLDSASASAQKSSSALGSSVVRGAKVAAFGLAGLGAAAVKVAADYEAQMNILKSVSGATGAEMGKLGKLAIKLGADTKLPGTSAKDASEAMTEMVKAGVSLKDTMSGVRGVLVLSAAAGVDNARAAEIASNALNAFKLKGKDVNFVVDQLANTANSSSVEINDVADSFKMAAAVFNAFQTPTLGAKKAMTEMNVAIGLLGNAGIKGSDAGTSLKQVLLQLAGPSSKAKDAMRGLYLAAQDNAAAQGHLTTIVRGGGKDRDAALAAIEKSNPALKKQGDIAFDASGKMRSLKDTIKLVALGTKGMTDEQKDAYLTQIFGADATRAVTILLQAQGKEYNRMEKAVGRSGAAQDLANAKMKGFKGSLEALKSSLETIGISVGTKLLPALTDLVKGFSNTLSDPNLTGAEKFKRITQTITDVVSKGFEAGIKVAGQAAPQVAVAFVTGFANAPPWAQLVSGGFILHKLGLLKKLFAVSGAEAGVAYSAAASSSMAASSFALPAAVATSSTGAAVRMTRAGAGAGAGVTAAEGAAAATAATSGFKASMAKVAPIIRRLAFIDLGLATISGVKDATQGKNWATVWQDAAHAASLGLIPSQQQTQTKNAAAAIGGLKQKLDDLATTSPKLRFVRTSLSELLSTGKQFQGVLVPQFDITKLRVGAALDYIKDHAHKLGPAGVQAATTFVQAVQKIQGGIETLRASGGDKISSLRRVFQSNMQLISSTLDTQTAKGASAARQNFQAFADAVATAMDRGVVSTKNGLAAITSAFAAELRALGYKGSISQATEIRRYQDTHGKGKGTGKATLASGGYVVGSMGQRGGDNVLMQLPVGAAVLNHHQQRALGLAEGGMVNAMVGRGEIIVPPGAVGGYDMLARANGYAGLGGLFASVTTPHSMASGGQIKTPQSDIGSSPLRAVAQTVLQKSASAANKRLSRLMPSGGGGGDRANMALGHTIMRAFGFGEGQWSALKALWQGESGWSTTARNKDSGAYGIPQSLPASKMASAGADWLTNPATQIKWGLNYIKGRYGSPAAAYAAWQSRSPHWYGSGGKVPGYQKGGAVGSFGLSNLLSSKFGLHMTSGFRTPQQNAAAGGVPNSWHTKGTPGNPGAIDLVGAMAQMRAALAWAKANVSGLAEAMIHNAGSGLHLHLAGRGLMNFVQGAGKGGQDKVSPGKKTVDALNRHLDYIDLQVQAGTLNEQQGANRSRKLINQTLPKLHGSARLHALARRKALPKPPKPPKPFKPVVNRTLENPWLQAYLGHQDYLVASGVLTPAQGNANKTTALTNALPQLPEKDKTTALGMISDMAPTAAAVGDAVTNEGARLSHIDAQARAGDITEQQAHDLKVASIQDALDNWVLTDEERLQLRGDLRELTMATTDNTDALKAQADALNALKDEVKRQTDFATSVANTESAAMAKWVTEVISKQMGFGISGRGQTPGYGVARRT